MFVAKYDFNGNPLWAKQSFGDTTTFSTTFGHDITIDTQGNSYITGYFSSDTVSFDSIQL